MQSFSTPENIRKLYAFLMFSGRRERVHWKKNGVINLMNTIDFTNHQKLQLVGFVKNNPDII